MFLVYGYPYLDVFHEFFFSGDGPIVDFGHKLIGEGHCYFFLESIVVFQTGSKLAFILVPVFFILLNQFYVLVVITGVVEMLHYSLF